MFRVASQKKFYAVALIVALLTLKASLTMPSLQRSPSDLHSGGTSLIVGTIIETSEGTPLRLGRVRTELPNFTGGTAYHAAARVGAEPGGSLLWSLASLSVWRLLIGREQPTAPCSDMVSRK